MENKGLFTWTETVNGSTDVSIAAWNQCHSQHSAAVCGSANVKKFQGTHLAVKLINEKLDWQHLHKVYCNS